MEIVLKNGKFNTGKLSDIANKNMADMEKASREKPLDVDSFPIGFIIPLGTLGNAPSQVAQFSSNFHIVAYRLADDLIDMPCDFEDLNTEESKTEQGQLIKLLKRIDELTKNELGDGWKITLFNVKLATALDSMCKGSKNIEEMNKSVGNVFKIVENRVHNLRKTSEAEPLNYELIELFYAPLKAHSISFTKIIDTNSKNATFPLGVCNSINIETLVYDSYANGLRLLANTESFASSKIREFSNDTESNIYLFVLKARRHGESSTFRPIRQFNGKSIISEDDNISGCAERIIYNLVNKNYRHWSFISLPRELTITISDLK